MNASLSSPARRLRAASGAMHGGASSLLRLGRGGEARLPSGAALAGWAERAATMLELNPALREAPPSAAAWRVPA